MKQILNILILSAVVALMSGVAQATPAIRVPDAGTTSSLMALALGGLTILRRFVR